MSDIVGPIAWSDDLERYFKSIGEQSNGLSWLHKRSEEYFSRIRNYIDLPVIIIGVLNGAMSVGSNAIFTDPKFSSIGVGLVAILGAILSTIASYFKYSARAESHRIASIQYSKFFRFIAVQLGLPRNERLVAEECLKRVKDENDHLLEISPLIPPAIIDRFKYNFRSYKNVSFPSECNGLEQINIYKAGEEEVIVSPKNEIIDLDLGPSKITSIEKSIK